MTPPHAAGSAVLIPVGPSAGDVGRLRDLLDSLTSLEPAARLCVLMDDAKGKHQRKTIGESYPSPDLVVLQNPRDSCRSASRGRTCLAPGNLSGWRGCGPTRKLTSCSSSISTRSSLLRFHAAVTSFLQAHSHAGLVGCIGETCDRVHERYLRVLSQRSFFRRAMSVVSTLRLIGVPAVARLVQGGCRAPSRPAIRSMCCSSSTKHSARWS